MISYIGKWYHVIFYRNENHGFFANGIHQPHASMHPSMHRPMSVLHVKKPRQRYCNYTQVDTFVRENRHRSILSSPIPFRKPYIPSMIASNAPTNARSKSFRLMSTKHSDLFRNSLYSGIKSDHLLRHSMNCAPLSFHWRDCTPNSFDQTW